MPVPPFANLQSGGQVRHGLRLNIFRAKRNLDINLHQVVVKLNHSSALGEVREAGGKQQECGHAEVGGGDAEVGGGEVHVLGFPQPP
jgi:hypothetical protein